MNLVERNIKQRTTSDLSNWRLQIVDGGKVRITGTNRWGFNKELINPRLVEFNSSYIVVNWQEVNQMLFYKDIDWSKPMTPTKMIPKIPHEPRRWYAINDLLAESSLYAYSLSNVLNLVELQKQYPNMYEDVDMDAVVGVVIGAIHQRDSKQSSELI